MKRTLAITIAFITISFASFGQKDSISFWISRIDNTSVAGTCHYGWVIEPTAKEVDKLIKAGKQVEKKLLKLLTDENKGIVAHYILSNIYRQSAYEIMEMDSLKIIYNYNGLEFSEVNGRMQTDKLKLEKCKVEWIAKIVNKKKRQFSNER